MPTYHYRCANQNCLYEFETYQSIKDDALETCMSCSEKTLHRVIYAAQVFSRQEPKTLGALAEQNTSKLGRYEKENLYQNMKERKAMAKKAAAEELQKKLPSGAKVMQPDASPIEIDKKLASFNNEQIRKYVDSGVKP